MATPADFVELRRLADLDGIAIDRRDVATLCGLFSPTGRIEVYQDDATEPAVLIAGHAEIGAIDSSSTFRTDVGETSMPTPLSSPTIRLYPQCGFSSASCRIRSRSERSSGGRPGLRCEYVHRRAIS